MPLTLTKARQKLLFLHLALLSTFLTLATGADDTNLKIAEQKTGSTATTLYASLTNCSEATITLTMTLDNAYASYKLPLTVDSKGRQLFDLVTVRPIDSRRAWNYHYKYSWQPGRRGNVATNSFHYHLPYRDGPYPVIQADFGSFSHQHGSRDEHAIDWAMPVGTRIYAARDGTVVAIREDSDIGGEDPKYKGANNYVVIRHDDGTFAEYCHLKKNGVATSLGQKVKKGDHLGFSGDTGFRSQPHLHFAVFQTIDGQTRKTFPIVFKTEAGELETLKEGQSY